MDKSVWVLFRPLLWLLIPFFPLVAAGQAAPTIVVSTRHTALVLRVHDKQLRQIYLGKALPDEAAYRALPGKAWAAYSTYGMDNLFSAAVRVTHADGNPSLALEYQDHQVTHPAPGITRTVIRLRDPQYPFEVSLYYEAYAEEDVIRQWTSIRHGEAAPVVLHDFASANLYLDGGAYWLTQFHGDWAKEMQMQESRLTTGIKIIDSKLGSRADMYANPSFLLSSGGPARENAGDVVAGTLAWTGNFQLLFEVDNSHLLRMLPGMNPYASAYTLRADSTFTTPAFLFTFSGQGTGQASRNLHRWARRYGLLDGDKPRMTLLNNWEATYFDFNEDKLLHLFDNARKIGVDLFLLDDGWFGNDHPRNNDRAGLGDWQANRKKLPHGIGYLVTEAQKRQLRFGIWIEPEMVNPQSDLYQRHPEWIIRLPNRPEHYYRHQLVLDLTNPAVQDFVFGVLDSLMTAYPGIAYIKWDCNRMFTNAYSPYLGRQQSHIYIAYVQGLYRVFERMRSKYPHLPVMLCSGGGGRVDYGALPYFTEYWPSDNTNPMDRIYIQWGYSYFFPAVATCNHVTGSGDYSLKFKLDVAMAGKLGFDMQFDRMPEKDIRFVQAAVQTYAHIHDLVWFGDLYRLISPYRESRAALMYVAPDKTGAVVFAYQLPPKLGDAHPPLRLQGLDAGRQYRVEEINLPEGQRSRCPEAGKTFSGAYLMSRGLQLPLGGAGTSAVFSLKGVG